MVNAEIGKKILSYDIVLKKYEDVYKKKILLDDYEVIKRSNGIDYKKLIYGIFIIFLILLIINFINILMNK
jgi:hypothetical protein